MSERDEAAASGKGAGETHGDDAVGGEREGLDTQDLYNGPDGYAEESAKSDR